MRIQEILNEGILKNLMKKIGTGIVNWTDQKTIGQLKNALDFASAPEVAVMIGQSKNPDDIRAAMGRWIEKHDDKEIKKLYDMTGS